MASETHLRDQQTPRTELDTAKPGVIRRQVTCMTSQPIGLQRATLSRIRSLKESFDANLRETKWP